MNAHAYDSAIAASRNCLDSEFCLTATERPEPLAETQEEFGDLHAIALGG